MLLDLQFHPVDDELTADVCVVGAGPVGITLGICLARSGLSVILLESGGAQDEPAAQSLNVAAVTGRRHVGVEQGRYRALGGTSTRWGGQILPFEPITFEARSWVPRSGWPFPFAELAPFYDRALELEGLAACMGDEAVWRGAGITLPGWGPDLSMHASRWCPEPNFARVHGRELAQSPDIRCLLHACVTSISVKDGTRIDSVVARSTNGKSARVRAKTFAFCGGAIETARLLLHPTEQGNAPPWAAPGAMLGRCFQDHPTFECADVLPNDRRALHGLMDMIYLQGRRYQPRLHLSRSAQITHHSLSVGGLLLFKSARAAAVGALRTKARQFLREPSPSAFIGAARTGGMENAEFLARQAWRYVVDKRAFNPDDLGIRLISFVEQPPRDDSRITLGQCVDAFGMRRATLNWVVGAAELEAVGHFALAVKTAFRDSGLAEVRIEPDLAAQAPGFLDRGWDNFHHMGTARMAEKKEDGVVDRNLAMFGTANGYVCGCAVFPNSGFSNPTHTAIALAIRLADHMAQAPRF